MARLLKWLALAMGIACAAIGLYHLVLGIASVPGEGSTGATVDSRERFYNAIFLGYGLAWIWAARQSPIPSTAVRWLAGDLPARRHRARAVRRRPRLAALVPSAAQRPRTRPSPAPVLAVDRGRAQDEGDGRGRGPCRGALTTDRPPVRLPGGGPAFTD